jgi:hypothetical protein
MAAEQPVLKAAVLGTARCGKYPHPHGGRAWGQAAGVRYTYGQWQGITQGRLIDHEHLQ